MVFNKQEEQEYRLLYLGGGAVHGVTQAQALIFLEELAGIPIAWQYDMISGDSVGSNPAAVLNCPKAKGSNEPKYSAKEYAYFLKDIVQKTFEPYRENYYSNMVALEVEIRALEKGIEVLQNWGHKKDKSAQKALSSALKYGKSIGHKIGIGTPDELDSINDQSALSFFNMHSGVLNYTVVPLLERRLNKAKDKVKNFFFSPDIIHDALDSHLVFEDGSPVMLSDTITGFHSEAFNIDKTKPEAHMVIKPIGNWEGGVSDDNIPLAEVPKRSMPAQTVFKPYFSPYSNCHYDDIAHHNTMA